MFLNRRAFILNKLMLLPLFDYHKPIKQISIIKSRNCNFLDIADFAKTLLEIITYNNSNYLNILNCLNKRGIIIQENEYFICNNTVRFERVWINKIAYKKWKISKVQKKSFSNLLQSNTFESLLQSFDYVS